MSDDLIPIDLNLHAVPGKPENQRVVLSWGESTLQLNPDEAIKLAEDMVKRAMWLKTGSTREAREVITANMQVRARTAVARNIKRCRETNRSDEYAADSSVDITMKIML